MNALSFFSKMPLEVYDQFVRPQINFEIDSVCILETLMGAPNWSSYFRNKPYSFWANLTWRKEQVLYKNAPFKSGALDLPSQLAKDFSVYGYSEHAKLANVKNSFERFVSCESFVRSHGKLPKPIVCLAIDEFWDVLDGNHRLAAVVSLKENDFFPIEAWVGGTSK